MTNDSVSKMVVGYLGPAGTHSHLAAISVFGPVDKFGFRYVPLKTLSETLGAVSEGRIGWAVLPYFNSTSGPVRAACPAIVDVRRHVFSELEICLSAGFQITHDLIGLGPLDNIRRVYSKREAIEQCKATVSQISPMAKLVETQSTAEAARLADREGGTTAAIASKMLLPFHRRLTLLKNGVQDESVNITRFMVVRRRSGVEQRPTSRFPRRTWIEFTNSDARPVLAKLLAAADKWGLRSSAISGAVVDAGAGAMRFLLELDHAQDSWKTQLFLSETSYLRPLVIGSPVVLEPAQHGLLQQWAQEQSSDSPQAQLAERREAIKRLTKNVRDSLGRSAEPRLIVHSPVSTMESVWEVLGVPPGQTLNTQVCINETSGRVAFCAVPGDRRIDVNKVSRSLGDTWRRARHNELASMDQAIGAISPLTASDATPILLDLLVPESGLVFVGSGDPAVSIVIDMDTDEILSGARRVDIAEG